MKCLGILMIASCLGNWMDSSSFETSYSFFFFFFFFMDWPEEVRNPLYFYSIPRLQATLKA